jgi:hypothetical protein
MNKKGRKWEIKSNVHIAKRPFQTTKSSKKLLKEKALILNSSSVSAEKESHIGKLTNNSETKRPLDENS